MRRIIVASLVLLLASAAAPPRAIAQTVYGGAQTVDGLQNRDNTRSNMQLQERRDAEWRRTFRAQDMIERERAALHPLKPPVLAVTPDAGAGELDALATGWRTHYFQDQTQAQVAAYVRARYDEYVAAMKARGSKPNDIASGCDYAAENLYAVGGGIDAAPDHATIRGTCVMLLQKNENDGGLATNAARLKYLEDVAVCASIYKDLDRRYAANGDTAKRAFFANDARTLFKNQYGIDLAAVPPSKFVCVFATPEVSCSVVARVYPKFAKKVAEEYP